MSTTQRSENCLSLDISEKRPLLTLSASSANSQIGSLANYTDLKFVFILFLQLFFHTICYSQAGMWTWVKGPNTTDQNATWGTKGVPAGANNPAACYGPFYWQDSNYDLWIWGGGNRTGRGQADMWKYNMASNQWTWMHGTQGLNSLATYGTQGVPAPGNIPAARQFGGASWIDAQNNLWLFGGDGWAPSNQNGTFAEMWRYNTATNEWTWMHGPQGVNQNGNYGVQGVSAPTNVPPSRREVCAAWVDNTGKFWMFGGENSNAGPTAYLNDVWRYDPATNEWTWMRGSSTPNAPGNYGTKGVPSPANDPPARGIHSHWIDRFGNLWFFGGGDDKSLPGGKLYNDLWKYDISTNQWTWMRGANAPNPPAVPIAACTPSNTVDPPARYENRMCWVDSCFNFWMFGGVNFGTGPFTVYNDLWFYNVQNDTWTMAKPNTTPSYGTQNVTAAGNYPTYRFGAAPFKDPAGNLWTFGGRDTMFSQGFSFSSHLSDIWRFNIDPACTPSSCSFVTANFTGANLTGCVAHTVTFTNTSSANSTQWHWDFGDGDTSNLQHPVHTYTAAGTYTVSLIASNSSASDTAVQINYVTVYPWAAAQFNPSADTVCIGQNITFTNGSTNSSSWSWNFGDGNNSSAQHPAHSYSAAGTYSVSLIAVNANGCHDTIVQPVTVLNISTIASFTMSPTIGCANLNVSFTNTSQNGTSYNWNLGNGNTSTSQNPSTTYTAAGTYTVTLISTATNSFCTTADTAIQTLTVTPGPALNASVTSNVSCFGGNNGIASAAASGGSPPYTYNWSTGATTSQISNLTSQIYSVTVTDQYGCSSTQTVQPTQPAALTGLTGSTPDTCAQGNGTASAAASGGTTPYSYSWSTGATTSQISNLTSQTYSVTITDAGGCTATQTVTIGTFTSASISSGANVSIQLGNSTALGATGGVSYTWSPATGLSCTNCTTPTASPTITTTYTVIGTDANGCTDLATVTVYVIIPCNSGFPVANAFSPNDDGENDYLCVANDPCLLAHRLRIFNRWGEMVYDSDRDETCWDGTFRGSKLNTAVFVYLFNGDYAGGKKLNEKGNITLVR